MKRPSRHTVKRSVSFKPELVQKGAEKAERNGQSFSSYINVLIQQDLNPAPRRKDLAAA